MSDNIVLQATFNPSVKTYWMFDIYRLSFETAGQSSDGALVSLIGIDDAIRFRETILNQKDKVTTNKSAPMQQNVAPTNDMALLLESTKRIERLLELLVNKK